MAAKNYQPAGYDTELSDAEWERLKPLIYQKKMPDIKQSVLLPFETRRLFFVP
jgi:hypothetical protein